MLCDQTSLPQQCVVPSVGSGTQMFSSLIQTLLAVQCSLSPPSLWPKDYGEVALTQGGTLQGYDFIVVGAGSAGCVVAGRLSENPKWKVLLIEAGGDPPIQSEIPSRFGTLQKTEYDWEFYAEAQTACKTSKIGKCYCPKRKMLGGSSAINGMIYTRGNKEDFDSWSINGNTGWDFNSILPYFKKSEHNLYEPFVNYKNGKYHSSKGPMKIGFFGADGQDFYRQIFLNAAAERGNKIIQDINADISLGFLNMQAIMADGRRQSLAKAFLVPAECRENLHVIKHAYAKKILIDKNNDAYGVEFVYKENNTMKAYTSKEAIVSAGVFLSPQLLMLSGIGPKDHLTEFNIDVKSDLPVGQNLIDHHSLFMWLRFNPSEASPTAQLDDILRYAVHGDGPLTSRGVTNINGFINLSNQSGIPEHQFQAFYYKRNDSGLKGYMDRNFYQDYIQQALLFENQNHDLVAIVNSYLDPKSRGYIKLNGTSYSTMPIVNQMYYSRQEDVEASLQAMKEQLAWSETKSFKRNGGQFIHIHIPECDQHAFCSDDYLRCFIHYFGTTNNHHIGTCNMGPDNDSESVVDPRLKLRNIGKLRVIDAGVIPTPIFGNTHAGTVMIAEKGSDIIKSDYRFYQNGNSNPDDCARQNQEIVY